MSCLYIPKRKEIFYNKRHKKVRTKELKTTNNMEQTEWSESSISDCREWIETRKESGYEFCTISTRKKCYRRF